MGEPEKLGILIREANDRFAAFFTRWSEAPKTGQTSLLTLLEQVPVVFAAVEAVGGAISPNALAASGLSVEDRAAADTYSANLKRFRQFLTELEPVLGERREHLAAAGLRLHDVKAWCDALKMTR